MHSSIFTTSAASSGHKLRIRKCTMSTIILTMTSEFACLAALQAVIVMEFISGCESEQDDKQAYVEKTYEAYRALLDRVPRVYDDALARARKAYTDASALL
jgi:hypothetical protein